jgi:hypothetical protein
MNSEIVKNLLKNSSIPFDPIQQREYIKNTFLKLHKINFNEFPDISLGEKK